MKKIVIFASGGGSNAESIINYLKGKEVEVSSIFVNKTDAGVIQIAENHNIPCVIFNRQEFNSSIVLDQIKAINPDLVVLAGFLWLIPANIVMEFPNKIVNIHPSLLPKYGGKGMHGINVHKAVKAAGESESGMTIHFVNDNYDEGNIIFQGKCKINTNDSPDDIARKVLKWEHIHYPKIIDSLLFG